MTIECDVLVVGGGPAGCSAARAAAMNGAKTILIEKKKEIGYEVKCAEGIGTYLFPYLPYQIPKEQLIWKMDGMYFQTDDISIEKTGDFWKSYSVDRKKFDKWISTLAIDKGAELFTNTELTNLELDEENNVKKAIVKRQEKKMEIKPKVVVAADGAESTVLNLMGLYNPERGDHAEVYSWEMKNLDLYKPNMEQVFTGTFTPCGYAYVFPKSKNTANIGVGGILPEKKMEQYFEEFIEIPHIKKQLKNAEYVIEKIKKAVWNDLSNKWIHNNVILSGDAANQNFKPFIEGIIPAIVCGDIAGKVSNDFLSKNDISHEYYYNIVKNKFDTHLELSNKIKEGLNYIFYQEDNKKYLQFFGIVTELLDEQNIEKTFDMDYNEIKSMIAGLKNGL